MPTSAAPPIFTAHPLEVWGGVECSHVRVGDRITDQLSRNGHDQRLEDLERFAALGLRTLRVAVLWERHAGPAVDWSVTDARLTRLRELGIRPIVGFVHHGAGPLPDGLLNPAFVPGLEQFARTVAERYPWIDAYTPVNEPLTTARFSGLYGVWYPHARSMQAFARCFLHQCAGVRAAMKAIRAVNPTAQLIQTEDVGQIHSTPALAYQAEFENERRWLTFDLLCGQLTRARPLTREYLLAAGLAPAELDSFVEDPCPPDILGMNHYITSERFLDEHVDGYPRRTHGGNGRDAYADVSAVRVRAEGAAGPLTLLRELWARYQRPLAVTEVQLACTREEQVRWLIEVWDAVVAARAAGIDVRAITPWALLGSFDWDSLLTNPRGHYENGAFDVRTGTPRPTLLAHAIRELASGTRPTHPALDFPGWWRRPIRLTYRPVSAPAGGPGTAIARDPSPSPARPPVLVIGAGGTLGSAVLRQCEVRGLAARGLRRRELDIGDADAVRAVLREVRPWAVVNAAGYVRVDAAETDVDECYRQNTLGAAHLAAACAELGARFTTFSSDLVFGGTKGSPYVEDDAPNPLNTYGRSKRDAEERIAAVNPAALIIRTSAFFGPWDEFNFATITLRHLAEGRRVPAPADFTVSPTYVPQLVNAVLDLLLDGESGLWHLANRGQVTWYHWAHALATLARLPAELIVPAAPHELGWIAPRPAFSALGTTRGALLGTWETATEQYMAHRPEWRRAVAA